MGFIQLTEYQILMRFFIVDVQFLVLLAERKEHQTDPCAAAGGNLLARLIYFTFLFSSFIVKCQFILTYVNMR
jgi:hypothetical protein